MPVAGNKKRYNDLQDFYFFYHDVSVLHCADANINKLCSCRVKYNEGSIMR